MVLEGVDGPGAVEFLRRLRGRGVVCRDGVPRRRRRCDRVVRRCGLRAQGGAEGEGCAVVLLAGSAVVG